MEDQPKERFEAIGTLHGEKIYVDHEWPWGSHINQVTFYDMEVIGGELVAVKKDWQLLDASGAETRTK